MGRYPYVGEKNEISIFFLKNRQEDSEAQTTNIQEESGKEKVSCS